MCVLLAAVWLVNGPVLFLQSDVVLAKFWRRQGFQCFLFYDGGFLAHQERREAFVQGQIVKSDVPRCGFRLSDAKYAWDPKQCVKMLGYGVDTLEGVFRVPDRWLERFETALGRTWAARRIVLGRNVA